MLQRMAKPSIQVEPVSVAAAVPLPLQNPGLLKVGHDTLDRPLRDTDPRRHFPEHLIRIHCQADQDMRVIAQKRPGRRP